MARTKTPTALLEARGAFDVHPERRPKGEPVSGKPLGSPVENLTDEEVKWWNFIVDRIPAGVAFNSDEVALTMAAKLMAEIMTADGINASAYNQLNSLISKFGMTPSDRAKIQVEAQEKSNPFAELND